MVWKLVPSWVKLSWSEFSSWTASNTNNPQFVYCHWKFYQSLESQVSYLNPLQCPATKIHGCGKVLHLTLWTPWLEPFLGEVFWDSNAYSNCYHLWSVFEIFSSTWTPTYLCHVSQWPWKNDILHCHVTYLFENDKVMLSRDSIL